MERLTSDESHLSAAEKTVSSSYYNCTRPSLNGYTNVAVVPSLSAALDETSEEDSERVGVFDYVLSPSQHGDKSHSSYSSTISTTGSDNVPGRSNIRHKWAQDVKSPADNSHCDNGTELTTFRCGSDIDLQPTGDNSSYVSGSDDAKTEMENCSELEEVVVHSEMQSQRASYERFDPDFPYSTACRSASVHEPARVFVTSTNKSSVQSSSRTINDAGDERDVIERRSRQCTPPSKRRTNLLLSTCHCVICLQKTV